MWKRGIVELVIILRICQRIFTRIQDIFRVVLSISHQWKWIAQDRLCWLVNCLPRNMLGSVSTLEWGCAILISQRFVQRST